MQSNNKENREISILARTNYGIAPINNNGLIFDCKGQGGIEAKMES